MNEAGFARQSFCHQKYTWCHQFPRSNGQNRPGMVLSKQQGRRKPAAHTTSPPATSWGPDLAWSTGSQKLFPKEPHSRGMRGAHGTPRAQAGVHRCTGAAQRDRTQWELNRNSTGTLQLGAWAKQRANSAKKVGRDKAAAAPPATDVVWVVGEAHAER